MKFKMQDKQNQLNDGISIGVDIAQQLHVLDQVNSRGIVIVDPFAFENNEDGFVGLIKWMEAAILGVEPIVITH
ncbi:hypothetical protein QNH26_14435 [Peribacillus frigoritolerans]|nr:hypothetical protein [Peribacillus frigoritolerans]WHX64916.1 hypothetical protein QNH26_14435 [Peribacillus frigoritolerans]